MTKHLRFLLAALVATTLVAAGCATDTEDEGEETPEPPSALVTFDGDAVEFSEGVAVDEAGNVFASISPLGRVVKIPAGSDAAEDFGKVEGLTENDLGLLGLATDSSGNVYGAVMAAGAEVRGVYRFDADTGEAERLDGTGDIAFPNSVVLDGDDIYITDTIGPDQKGAVWRITGDGSAELWAQDDALAGDGSAGFGFPLGPNGIDVHNDTVYVGLTEPAKIVTIAISDDGSAGDVELFADLTTAGPDGSQAAVDGIDVDDDGNVYVAAPLVHTVLKVSADGEDVETVADAEDGLDGPASVALDDDVLYVANFSGALGEASNGQGPGITRVPLTD